MASPFSPCSSGRERPTRSQRHRRLLGAHRLREISVEDVADIAARQADIGQLAVGQLEQLGLRAALARPGGHGARQRGDGTGDRAQGTAQTLGNRGVARGHGGVQDGLALLGVTKTGRGKKAGKLPLGEAGVHGRYSSAAMRTVRVRWRHPPRRRSALRNCEDRCFPYKTDADLQQLRHGLDAWLPVDACNNVVTIREEP